MKTNTNRESTDDVAAIGIGAMIVFIALILVAAVAALGWPAIPTADRAGSLPPVVDSRRIRVRQAGT